MRVFRIVREKYLADVRGGNGAALAEGNRWNSFGTRLVYTSDSRALVLLEQAVHLDLSNDLPNDRYMLEIEIADTLAIQQILLKDLPQVWNQSPQGGNTRKIGDAFAADASTAVLKVPGSIAVKEHNYLINPSHPEASAFVFVYSEKLNTDQRLL